MARLNQSVYPPLSAGSLHAPVVFVVDMVNGFTKEGALADPAILACARPIQKLVETIHPALWFVNDSHDENSSEFASFPPHCIKGTSEALVIEELARLQQQAGVLEKNAISAAFAPGFSAMLESLPETCDLIVTGCCTDLCVLQLVLPLLSWLHQNNRQGCRVIVPADCVETYDAPGLHEAGFWNEAALANMAANGALVVGSIQEGLPEETK